MVLAIADIVDVGACLTGEAKFVVVGMVYDEGVGAVWTEHQHDGIGGGPLRYGGMRERVRFLIPSANTWDA